MTERTPTDYALEFAEYMAKGAEQLIEAVNALALAEQARDEGDGDELDAKVDEARQDCTEFLTGLRNDIYQFRTRRDRAARAAPSLTVGDEPRPPSPTAGMTLAQRILHVGGRNNAAGYVEFGSTQAVEALVRQVLRDLPAAQVGRTNSGDETGGAVKRFGLNCTGSGSEIIPATNGAFVWYDDYLTLWRSKQAQAAAQAEPVAPQRGFSTPWGDADDSGPDEYPAWPIAKLTVAEDGSVSASLYAPGLPDGEFDVFLEPPSHPPAQGAGERVSPEQWRALIDVAEKAGELRGRNEERAKRLGLAQAPAAEPQWQPIETAPRDGTPVALYSPGRVTFGEWVPERWPTASEYHATTGEYLGQHETGECHPAHWASWDGGFTDEEPPTHWAPLPPAPVSHPQPADSES